MAGIQIVQKSMEMWQIYNTPKLPASSKVRWNANVEDNKHQRDTIVKSNPKRNQWKGFLNHWNEVPIEYLKALFNVKIAGRGRGREFMTDTISHNALANGRKWSIIPETHTENWVLIYSDVLVSVQHNLISLKVLFVSIHMLEHT